MLTMPTIKNSKGEVMVPSSDEKLRNKYLANEAFRRFGSRAFKNSLGYEVAITTLTTIARKISEQSFYDIPFADYIPVVVGEGQYSTNLTIYRSFNLADAFETGVIDSGGDNQRLAAADAGVDALNIKIFQWAKSIGWSIFDLELAAKSGNWDLVSQKEKARKINWDLGLQKIAFLGASGQNAAGGACLGLLNQTGITTNTTLLTAPINTLTSSQLKTFIAQLIELYRNNNNRTKWPTAFVIPESDYNGLASQSSPEFPIKSTLELMEEAFKLICRNKNFKILPVAYADGPYNGTATQIYTLLNYDEESLRMSIPLQYTNTIANSLDNFSFQNVGFGQYTGLLCLKPLELMYFTFPTPSPFV